MKTTRLLGLLLIYIVTFSQPNKLCDSPEFSQFDFWIGEWEVTWTNQNNDIEKGTNSISKILDDCVIEENFNAPTLGFSGKSVSTYSTIKKQWMQTWVDNNGGYLDFEGGMVGDKMILSRSFNDKDGNHLQSRMVFKNIEENSFDWSWERSEDNGNRWQVKWLIHYKRK